MISLFPVYVFGEPEVHYRSFFLCCPSQRSARSQVPSQMATHQEIGSQVCAGETPNSNPGLQDNSLGRYHWATMPPPLSHRASKGGTVAQRKHDIYHWEPLTMDWSSWHTPFECSWKVCIEATVEPCNEGQLVECGQQLVTSFYSSWQEEEVFSVYCYNKGKFDSRLTVSSDKM